jgi:hypothetical protein
VIMNLSKNFPEKCFQESWCERGDSNPHGCPLDPKSSASASSATLARNIVVNNSFLTIFNSQCRVKITQGYVKASKRKRAL